jgi:hypothetical protein
MEADVLTLLSFFFVSAWYHSEDFFSFDLLCNKLVNVRLEVFFPPMQRCLLKNAFHLLKTLLGLFFLVGHACSALGIHGL